ncbi:hypothetical protein FHL15_007911 [Xylaria flabelliformis]|uniref:Heterokaryon incompatibility domain-containing protein n=1 Tax=Xylaria flabelliformis TaxID=2512241 RepID=A0A553HT44_9PEZI|nr:hypothetical protein FHL15_007911 [Xylaria flabelliformis]
MDDSKNTLGQITVQCQRPIISSLLDIQRYQASQDDFLNFLSNLECFYFNMNGTTLYRRDINACSETDYIALSYTWDPSPDEDPSSNGYSIKTRCRTREFPSPVRNCVFARITKYMQSEGVKLLWIDRHSIPQQTCNQPACEHRKCRKKKAGLQCMDWVYKRSKHPVALLGRPLASRGEFALLSRILEGKLVNKSARAGHFELSQMGNQLVMSALRLLYEITSDLWWQRAWTFQENYKGGTDMTLLIGQPPPWKLPRSGREIFGDVPGELCVNSRLFSDQATKLCLAFRRTERPTLKEKEMIESVLSKAGKYTLLLHESQTMSPTIISDVEKRDVRQVWDRLAIVGNCCSYSIRMDIERLRQTGRSLSLSMLAMYLLNGEILDNRASNEYSASNDTVSEFLKIQSFSKISSPQEHPSLTFNKGSRFFNVKLSESGILTYGHLWKLGRVIQTAGFSGQLPWVECPRGYLSLSEQRHLIRLTQELETLPESTILASHIANYLKKDAICSAPFQIGENYMGMMMAEVSKAVEDGKTLRLGSLYGSEECRAIFVWDGDEKTGFIFTSSWPKNSNSEGLEANDTDRHVSLEVELTSGTEQTRSQPHLYTKRWVSGVCFFVECPRRDVVFPWPPALKNIGL